MPRTPSPLPFPSLPLRSHSRSQPPSRSQFPIPTPLPIPIPAPPLNPHPPPTPGWRGCSDEPRLAGLPNVELHGAARPFIRGQPTPTNAHTMVACFRCLRLGPGSPGLRSPFQRCFSGAEARAQASWQHPFRAWARCRTARALAAMSTRSRQSEPRVAFERARPWQTPLARCKRRDAPSRT